jgi:two-component system sensor histidine kinase RstB
MNRLTLLISGGVLAAVLMSTVAVQLFLDWQVESSADQTACTGAATLPSLGWPSVLLLVAAAVAFVTLVGALLSRPVLRRLRLLEQAAGRIAAGELQARAAVSGHDPIARFAARFNQMADRNQRLLEGQRHLLQAVSHELRTPASRIRFGLEMLREAATSEERERHGAFIDAALDEIDDLVQELLILNRLDGGAFPLVVKRIDAAGAVHDEYALLAPLRPELEAALPDRRRERLFVSASDKLFRRALRNILSNAVRHARRRIRVTFERRSPYVRVLVDDDGPGVPEAARARILEPFARVDVSRSRGSGGFGLGLAIVARIVRAHQGALEVTDAPGGGARFVMTWPESQHGEG